MSPRAVTSELNVHLITVSHLQCWLHSRPCVIKSAQELHTQPLHLQECQRQATWTADAIVGLQIQFISAQTARECLRESHLRTHCPHRGSWPNCSLLSSLTTVGKYSPLLASGTLEKCMGHVIGRHNLSIINMCVSLMATWMHRYLGEILRPIAMLSIRHHRFILQHCDEQPRVTRI